MDHGQGAMAAVSYHERERRQVKGALLDAYEDLNDITRYSVALVKLEAVVGVLKRWIADIEDASDGDVLYRGCKIVQSNTRLQDGRWLYNIEGSLNKPAVILPWLPTVQSAQDWIDEQLAAHETTKSPDEL